MQESPIMASKCVFPPLKVVGGETNHSIVPFIVSGRDSKLDIAVYRILIRDGLVSS